MKLKTVFLIFNGIIVVSFLFVFAMPILFLGLDYAVVFWRENWYLAALFLGVLAILNGYFVYNWKLFGALEAGRWDAVAEDLMNRVVNRRRWSTSNVRLLINALVVTGKMERIGELEETARRQKPQVIKRSVLLFAIPHLLSNDGDRLAQYCREFRQSRPRGEGLWLEWYLGFAHMMRKDADAARDHLLPLLQTETHRGSVHLVQALAGYLLEALRSDETVAREIDNTRAELTKRYDRSTWQRMVERERGDLYVVVLSRLLNDVAKWLFPEGDNGDSNF